MGKSIQLLGRVRDKGRAVVTKQPPLMWPLLISRKQRNVSVEFVNSRPCSERFFSGYKSFYPSIKNLQSQVPTGLKSHERDKRGIIFSYVFENQRWPTIDDCQSLLTWVSGSGDWVTTPCVFDVEQIILSYLHSSLYLRRVGAGGGERGAGGGGLLQYLNVVTIS